MKFKIELTLEEALSWYGSYCRQRHDWPGARAIAGLLGVNCNDKWGDPVTLGEFKKRLIQNYQDKEK